MSSDTHNQETSSDDLTAACLRRLAYRKNTASTAVPAFEAAPPRPGTGIQFESAARPEQEIRIVYKFVGEMV